MSLAQSLPTENLGWFLSSLNSLLKKTPKSPTLSPDSLSFNRARTNSTCSTDSGGLSFNSLSDDDIEDTKFCVHCNLVVDVGCYSTHVDRCAENQETLGCLHTVNNKLIVIQTDLVELAQHPDNQHDALVVTEAARLAADLLDITPGDSSSVEVARGHVGRAQQLITQASDSEYALYGFLTSLMQEAKFKLQLLDAATRLAGLVGGTACRSPPIQMRTPPIPLQKFPEQQAVVAPKLLPLRR
eukprot:NODE_380_length_2021_cov_136.895987_g373_i0.p1 GENE.NODE_380_length_2021_cov_136.895987_g373_i0~~NODE_380_length_2021_cov_136.895987_g373_i0.p1  ORF type:complete len:242 (+),score=31.66 NODE_380_length_2021_cov_136.895987_g373_i0:95-820(+)